ncbi:MAG: hypothetical protein WCL16_06925 [bacterium]
MKSGAHPAAGRWALIGAGVAIILAATLACRLEQAWSKEVPDAASGAAARLLGESRRTLSGDLYTEGDVFFHRGGHYSESTAFTNRFYQRIGNAISPSQHLHSRGGQAAEVLPWLRLATAADPHNVEAWMTAAFLAGTAAGRADVAADILAEARAVNPRDYRLPLEQARLLLRQHAWERAGRELETAQHFWPNPAGPNDDEARMDRAEVLTYRGYLLELGGKTDAAINAYRQALELFPERAALADRANRLASRQAPALDIQSILNNVFIAKSGQDEHDVEKCEEEHAGAAPHLNHVIR